jgi:hypothetical protein
MNDLPFDALDFTVEIALPAVAGFSAVGDFYRAAPVGPPAVGA